MNRNQCTPFLRGYLEAALFTTDTRPPSGQDYIESGRADEMFPQLPACFISQAKADCEKFEEANAPLLAQAGTDEQNGRDFWYTRNRHGVGFWDRDYAEEASKPLTDAAHAFGEHYLDAEDIGQEAEP